MPRRSAGILLFRRAGGRLEVLLVHPGGPFWRNKDKAAWSIPKGEYPEDEDPLTAAKREVREETGLDLDGAFLALAPRKQSNGKLVHIWALEGDCDPASITSNSFAMEWPPGSGRQQEFPEVDRAAWFDMAVARDKIHKGQVGFLDELARRLDPGGKPV